MVVDRSGAVRHVWCAIYGAFGHMKCPDIDGFKIRNVKLCQIYCQGSMS